MTVPSRRDFAAEAAARLSKRIFRVRVERDSTGWYGVSVMITNIVNGTVLFEGPADKELLRWFKRNQLVFFAFAEIFGKKNPILKIIRKDPDAPAEPDSSTPPLVVIRDEDIPW